MASAVPQLVALALLFFSNSPIFSLFVMISGRSGIRPTRLVACIYAALVLGWPLTTLVRAEERLLSPTLAEYFVSTVS
jgi:hypothetical protein